MKTLNLTVEQIEAIRNILVTACDVITPDDEPELPELLALFGVVDLY